MRFRFATQSRWIAGQISTVHNRLLDVLNAEGIEVLPAEQVEVWSYRDRRVGALGSAEISLDKVLLAVPIEDVEKPAGWRDPMVWVKKKPEWARLGLGPYEVVGQVHLAALGQVAGFFSVIRERFIPMTGVSIRRIDDPAFSERLEVVLVNRTHVDYFAPVSP